MNYHVHVKNEAGRDDNVTVEASSDVEAEVLAMEKHPATVVAIGAEPAWHDVTVHWPDRSSHDDGIRGADRGEALANAELNWISGNPYGAAVRIEYRGQSGAAEQDGWAR